jgi:hypothetical protein
MSISSSPIVATNFNYNALGHTFAGGPINGDGSGLTNLNAVTTESDPAFVSSAAAGIAATNITAWNSTSTETLRLDGTRAMQAGLDMGGHSVTNVGEITLQTNLTVQGAFTALCVPRQGDLLMGSYTNGL